MPPTVCTYEFRLMFRRAEFRSRRRLPVRRIIESNRFRERADDQRWYEQLRFEIHLNNVMTANNSSRGFFDDTKFVRPARVFLFQYTRVLAEKRYGNTKLLLVIIIRRRSIARS